MFFVCEYLLCNLLNTVVFLNGERFYPIVINMISQLTQIYNLASAEMRQPGPACTATLSTGNRVHASCMKIVVWGGDDSMDFDNPE